MCDLDVVAGRRLFPVVRLHLRVDKGGNRSQVELQNLLRIVLGQIGEQVPNDLASQVEEHVGIHVIGHIIEINEAHYDEVLQSLFIDATGTKTYDDGFSVAQVLEPEVIAGRCIVERRKVECEGLEP